MDFIQGNLFPPDPKEATIQKSGIDQIIVESGLPPYRMLSWLDVRTVQTYGNTEGDSPERDGTFLFRTAVVPDDCDLPDEFNPKQLTRAQYFARVGARFAINSNILSIGGIDSGLPGVVNASKKDNFEALVLVCLRDLVNIVEDTSRNPSCAVWFRNLVDGYVEIYSEDIDRLHNMLRVYGIFGSIISIDGNNPDPDTFNASRNRLDEPQAKPGILKIRYQAFLDRILS